MISIFFLRIPPRFPKISDIFSNFFENIDKYFYFLGKIDFFENIEKLPIYVLKFMLCFESCLAAGGVLSGRKSKPLVQAPLVFNTF